MRFSLLAVVLASLGCGDATAPQDLFVDRPDALVAPGPGPHATRLGDFIVVQGRVGFPDPCHELDARLDRSGPRLEVTLHARRVAQFCIAVVGSTTYRIFVPATPAPTRLTLRYEGAISGGPFEFTVP